MSLQNQPTQTPSRLFRKGFSLAACALLAIGACHYWSAIPQHKHQGRDLTEDWTRALPKLARAPGGLLEVGTMTAPEEFISATPHYILGIYRGTTKAALQTQATYRYHVPLTSAQWSVVLRGPMCVVTVPDIAPTLPVCFDSAKVRANAESGWACWDKADRLEELRANVTAELARRAGDDDHLVLAREVCRHTVAEFVGNWLVQEKGWREDPDRQVVVRFQSETVPAPDADSRL